MPAPAATNSGLSLLVLAAFVAIVVLAQRGRRQSRSANLERGERMRPLAITCIDPFVSLVIIGPLLWRLVHAGGANLLGAVAGAAVGVVIGYFRARVMFVRADKTKFSVVFKRSGVEYGLVLLLIVLRSIEGQLELGHVSAATVFVAALSGLGLAEAFARAGFIIARYVTHPAALATGDDGIDPPQPPLAP